MDNIYSVSKPFLVFLKLCGFFPLSLNDPLLGAQLVFKWYNLTFTVSNFSILLFLILSSSLTKLEYYAGSDILAKGWMIMSDYDVLCGVVLLLYQLSRQSKICSFLTKIQEFDQKVSFLNTHK